MSARMMDHAKRETEYATVKATIVNLTQYAVLLRNEKCGAAWVPKFALDPVSRALLHRSKREDEVELQVELDLALKKSLV